MDEVIANARALYLEGEIAQGKTIEELMKNDSGREFILPLLVRQQYFQNARMDSLYNYSIIDGFELNTKDIKVVKVKNKSIILASDGYPKLFNTLSDSEKYLEYILKNDPLCIKLHKSTKGLKENLNSFDDRAYIKIEKY